MLKRLALILALALGLPLSALAPADAASFPFTCKIGTMNAASWTAPNSAEVTFSRSKGPASSGLQPGECAYSNRAVKASEPDLFCPFKATTLQMGFHGTPANRAPSVFGGPGSVLLAAAVSGPTKLMNFMVHNGGEGPDGPCFVIDHFGGRLRSRR